MIDSGASILSERRGAVGLLTINRPGVRNALTPEVAGDLRKAVNSFDEDPAIRAIVLTGAGSAFCAGGDIGFLKRLRDMSQDQIKNQVYDSFQGATRALLQCTKPVVAAVQGPAYGAGCEIAVACDFRIVSHEAVFCENWVELGITPALGGMFLLPRLVGLERATDMVMRASKITGRRAVEIGLASQSVDGEVVLETALSLAQDLAARPREALAAIKRGLCRGLDGQLATEWEAYASAQATIIAGADFATKVDEIDRQLRGRPQQR